MTHEAVADGQLVIAAEYSAYAQNETPPLALEQTLGSASLSAVEVFPDVAQLEAAARTTSHTQRLSEKILATPIAPEDTATFREFMTDFGFPLYRAIRKVYGKNLDTIEDRCAEMALYMAGNKREEIGKHLGTAMYVSVLTVANNFSKTLHRQYSADAFSAAFIAYKQGEGYPDISMILHDTQAKIVGKAAVKEAAVITDAPEVDTQGAETKPNKEALPSYRLLNQLKRTLPSEKEAGSDWRQRALCTKVEPKIFHPPKGASMEAAKRVCSRCDVREKCLEVALENDERHGVWGGLSEYQRAKLKP